MPSANAATRSDDRLGLRARLDLAVGPPHGLGQAVVDRRLVPAEVLEVLHPLQVGHDHAAGVGQQVGHDRHALVHQQLVGPGGGRAVGALHDQLGRHRVGVALVDHAAQRRGDQQVAGGGQQLVGRDLLHPVELGDLAALGHVRGQRVGVDAAVGVHGAVGVGHGHHRRAQVLGDPPRPGAHVAEALDRPPWRATGRCRPCPAADLNTSITPRPVAASRPAEPSSDSGLPVTMAGVWPCSLPYSSMNQAMTCAFVPTSGAGMSRPGPSTLSTLPMNERATFCSSAWVSVVRVHVHPALGPAEGDPGDGGLPAHQLRQRTHLVQVHLGVEAHAALVRAAGGVVLDAEARGRCGSARRPAAPGSAP